MRGLKAKSSPAAPPHHLALSTHTSHRFDNICRLSDFDLVPDVYLEDAKHQKISIYINKYENWTLMFFLRYGSWKIKVHLTPKGCNPHNIPQSQVSALGPVNTTFHGVQGDFQNLLGQCWHHLLRKVSRVLMLHIWNCDIMICDVRWCSYFVYLCVCGYRDIPIFGTKFKRNDAKGI